MVTPQKRLGLDGALHRIGVPWADLGHLLFEVDTFTLLDKHVFAIFIAGVTRSILCLGDISGLNPQPR